MPPIPLVAALTDFPRKGEGFKMSYDSPFWGSQSAPSIGRGSNNSPLGGGVNRRSRLVGGYASLVGE